MVRSAMPMCAKGRFNVLEKGLSIFFEAKAAEKDVKTPFFVVRSYCSAP